MERLTSRRVIRATPERLFQAWTDPIQLLQWWGPDGVECIDAHIDTEVVVVHERIPTDDLRRQHQAGWAGCLDGLERYLDHRSGGR